MNTSDNNNNNMLKAKTFKNHFDELINGKSHNETMILNTFPIEIFPIEIQKIIKETNETLNYPIDFIGSSILFATSLAIGNSLKVRIKNGWVENTVLYLCLVGNKGINKSHPISWALKPLEEVDKLNYEIFLEKIKEYEANQKITKKEREEQGIEELVKPFWEQCLVSDFTPEALISLLKQNKRGIGVYSDELSGWIANFNRYNKGSEEQMWLSSWNGKPIWEQCLVSDFTPEALISLLKQNKRGIGVYSDELSGWIANFNRYNKGSEEQMWLSSWNGKPIRINRKSSEPIFIPYPFISVIGTIQPSVLKIFGEKNRAENGFLDRLIFTYVEDLNKPYWSEEELNPEIPKSWDDILTKISNLPIHIDESGNPISEILEFSIEAKKRIYEWQRKITDFSNESKNDDIMGINAKIEMYAIRFSLILQMQFFACGEEKDSISLKAVNGAIALVEYFTKSAIRVRERINNFNPLDNLTTDKINLYNVLPDTFTTKQGTQLAFVHGISERTFKRMLNDKELFEKRKQGEYSKTL